MKTRRRVLLDILCAHYPEKNREEHLAAVLCGEVYADGERVRDPRRLFAQNAAISFAAKGFVSRGGGKLEAALAAWGVDAAGKTVLDAGCSTGGFTHCLLERGAARVHAVDVGYGQIHPSLRADPRVLLREKTNIMALDHLEPQPAFAVCDLSFRSLRGAARHIIGLTAESRLVALVKPQFEWETPPEDFDGVVRAISDLRNILFSLAEALEQEGVFIRDMAESPLRGHAGNREFLFDLNTARGLAPEALRRKIAALTMNT
jgi:23S rRNA (cytidine1920-2'-O)/16S rRNA (cytidine1409-2'-O)-methyltransferase